MTESLTPRTDNLYEFLAIGGLACRVVGLVFLVRDRGVCGCAEDTEANRF